MKKSVHECISHAESELTPSKRVAGSELFSRDHQMKVFVSTVEHQESTCALSHGMQLSSILIPSILLPLGLISMAEFIKCGIWWGEGNWNLLTIVDLGLIFLYPPRIDSQASFPGEIAIVTPFIASLLRSYWLKTRVSSVMAHFQYLKVRQASVIWCWVHTFNWPLSTQNPALYLPIIWNTTKESTESRRAAETKGRYRLEWLTSIQWEIEDKIVINQTATKAPRDSPLTNNRTLSRSEGYRIDAHQALQGKVWLEVSNPQVPQRISDVWRILRPNADIRRRQHRPNDWGIIYSMMKGIKGA